MNKPPANKITLEREIKRLQRMQDWTTLQGKIWIGISFSHMMVTMALFRTDSTGLWRLVQTLVMGITVLLLDLGIMHYSHIIYKTKEAGLETPIRPYLTYLMAVAAEWIFNFTSLYSNRPPAAVMPGFMSAALAFLFGSFVTLSILNAPMLVDLLDKIASFHVTALTDIAKAEQEEQERKAKAERDEEERREDLRRKNEDRRARRQLTGPSTIPENRRLPQVDEDDKYQPNAVNVASRMVVMVDEKPKAVDARAVGWLTLNVDNKMSAQAISDHLGGRPSKAYISLHIKLYREWLAVHQEVT